LEKKIDLTVSGINVSPWILPLGDIRFMLMILWGFRGEWGAPNMQFLVISVAISSESLELRPTLLDSDIKYLVDFPMTLKRVTLNV